MDKKIAALLKKENIKYYTWVDCQTKTINKLTKTIIGKKAISVPYLGFDIIKQNNTCNYFKFREYTHDIKSHINAVYGMASIMSYDVDEVKPEEVNGIDINSVKDNMKEINDAITELTNFCTKKIQSYENDLNIKGNLCELMIYYIPTYCDYFIIDNGFDAEFDNCYDVMKRVTDALNSINKQSHINNLIFIKNKNEIVIKNWNGECKEICRVVISYNEQTTQNSESS